LNSPSAVIAAVMTSITRVRDRSKRILTESASGEGIAMAGAFVAGVPSLRAALW